MGVVVQRFEVYLTGLDPVRGREMKKTRPCLIVSPDEMNKHIGTVLIAPMTTKGNAYPSRVACTFQGKKGQIVLDQIRAIDKTRLLKRLGRIGPNTQKRVLEVLQELFAE